MIKIIDDKFSHLSEFENFCKTNSFGTRIFSHYLCYGHKYDFVDFWVQFSDNGIITSAICKFEGDIIVCLCDDSDFDEISYFISFQKKLSVSFDYKYKDRVDCDDGTVFSGDILMYKSCDDFFASYTIDIPQLKSYHNLLLSCKSSDFFVPEYMNFLSDVSRRQQQCMCDIFGIHIDDVLVSCAMTVSYTDFSVILGAVATHPEHRKHGYAGCVVKSLAEKHKYHGSVYIYTTIERNTRFYESLGFVVTDKWIKYTYGG